MAKNALFSGFDPYNGFFGQTVYYKSCSKLRLNCFGTMFFSHFVQILTYSVIFWPQNDVILMICS